MIALAEIIEAAASEFLVRPTQMHQGRRAPATRGTPYLARLAYALAAQCLTPASDRAIAGALGFAADAAPKWREAAFALQGSDPVFARRVETVVQRFLRVRDADSEREATKQRCAELACVIDQASADAEDALVADALSDTPVRAQLELETLLALDADRACFAAASAALRRLACTVEKQDRPKATGMRHMAARLAEIAGREEPVDGLVKTREETSA